MSDRTTKSMELLRLCGKVRDDALTPEDTVRLDALLQASDQAKALYVQYMSVVSLLESRGVAEHLAVQEAPTNELNDQNVLLELLALEEAAYAPIVEMPKPLHLRVAEDKTPWEFGGALRYLISRPATWTAAAAVLVLALILGIVFSGGDQPLADNTPTESHKPAASTESTPRGSDPVATLTATHNAQWDSQPAEDLRRGSKLHPNQRLTLTAGFAEITTNDGAIAILEAPATIELIDSPNAIRLHAGKLVGICETELSKGFVVKTDYADITDLGTEFGVNVANHQLTTTVFAGEVVLSTPGQAPTPLVANQTATLDVGVGARVVVQERVAEGFTLRLPRVTTAEQVQSRATPIAAWDFFGQDTRHGIHSGDASTASGLQMTGFTGQWGTLPPHQGEVKRPDGSVLIGETTGQSNGITLRWAVDGVGATAWAFQTEGAGHALLGDYYYINRKGDRWGGAAIPWRIEGLTPGARYDLIFFGTRSHYQNGAHIAIEGHDAGNGVGAAATLDDENDANFRGVVADARGMIAGTFGNPGDVEAQVAGVQIGLLPDAEPTHQRNNQPQR